MPTEVLEEQRPYSKPRYCDLIYLSRRVRKNRDDESDNEPKNLNAILDTGGFLNHAARVHDYDGSTTLESCKKVANKCI